MKEPRSGKKIKLSRSQYDQLRIFYAVVLATKLYGLDADTLFIHGLNPDWIAQRDVLSITTNLHDENKMLNQLFETGKWGIGYWNSFDTVYYWMQKGGQSCGGKSIQIHKATFWSMVNRGLLVCISKSNFGKQEFKLNEKAQKD